MSTEKQIETKATGEVTPAQIAAWKKKYGDRIFSFIRDGHVAYLRKPDRVIMSFLATVSKDQFNTAIVENCWLGGSDFLKTDEDAFLWLCGELTVLLDWGTGELKKI